VEERKSSQAHDVVTRYDREAEERLTTDLAAFDHSIGKHGEEFGADGSTETFWLIDALDATGRFVRGIPGCTTMAALVYDGRVVACSIV
jgi:myo-inositol-1(or 4)-monophosphatase